MNKLFYRSIVCLLQFCAIELPAQDLRFNQVLKNSVDQFDVMEQDKQGVIWFLSQKGLTRYDGDNITTFANDPGNPASIVPGPYQGLAIDADNIIWMGALPSGLQRFDPATNTFTQFRHNPKDDFSLSSDTVVSVFAERSGNIWVCTSNGGLDLLDKKTGKFTRYRSEPNDFANFGKPYYFNMYEDKKGTLWFPGFLINTGSKSIGTLDRFEKATGKFTHFILDSAKIKKGTYPEFFLDAYEDSKNNFWVGTINGLYSMDRNTGIFTRFYPDPFKSSVLSQTPVAENIVSVISFITEDASGALWVGMGHVGLNRYDPVTKMSTHFGKIYDENNKLLTAKDTATGLTADHIRYGKNSKDGLFWVFGNGVYQMNLNKTTIPFFKLTKENIYAHSFYLEPNGKILWMTTNNSGFLRKDLISQTEKYFGNVPDDNKIVFNHFGPIVPDDKGNLWLGRDNAGLVKFNPVNGEFIHYRHDPKDSTSILDNTPFALMFDHNKYLWISSYRGISKMDKSTGKFTNYPGGNLASDFGQPNDFLSIAEDAEHYIWTSSDKGVMKLDTKSGKFQRYMTSRYVKSILIDSKGNLWAGSLDGLYIYNKEKDEFELFANEQSAVGITDVINIAEDNQKNLWVFTNTTIIRINEDRTRIKKFTEANGVHKTNFRYNLSFKASDGRIYFGIEGGYYSFYPDKISDNTIVPLLHITGFKFGTKELKAEKSGVLAFADRENTEIKLHYDQNVFSFDFFATDFIYPGQMKYLVKLENYDNDWRDIGNEHFASYFNIPPGEYIFRVKAISGDGGTAEKSIHIIISPPWWETWWFRILSAIALVIIISAIIKERSRKLKEENLRLEQKVTERTALLNKSLEELKSAQALLIQSEKMASLGELTAGIAHEIQNPLNFINNFSELNNELLDEMKVEFKQGKIEDGFLIADDIKQNMEKIRHHGNRADAIVKGMLLHSQSGSGVKEPTDINALTEEYLRLAYHACLSGRQGLKAKEKPFKASIKTDFDQTIGNINIVPQDIGRVLLNLFNNAFYAVNEKMQMADKNYEPAVKVTTRLVTSSDNSLLSAGTMLKRNSAHSIIISVRDNGIGIPESIKDKIFQPFYTTKPTGQGTGLGLSLSYDIVKAHGGELIVKTLPGEAAAQAGNEGGGTEFIIQLPH